MAKKNRIGLAFSGWDDLLSDFEAAGGDVKQAAEKALVQSQKIVAEQTRAAMPPHRRTGQTEESIVEDAEVEWEGLTAGIKVGFSVSDGGLASIFLMYGTARHSPNHPGTAQDKKLYNAVYGSGTRRKVGKAQEDLILEAVERRMG